MVGVWDASGTGDSAKAQLEDLTADVGPSHSEENETFLGWTGYAENNGIAWKDRAGSLCATRAPYANWFEEQIAQHEISHNFDAPDRGTLKGEHPECIMNEEWAYSGTTIWDTEDWDIVNYNITGQTD